MRFQAEIPSKDASMLESLTKELAVQSNAELLGNLLSIASWIVSERRLGHHIVSLSDDRVSRELVSPLFERVAPQHELPHTDILWTKQELAQLAKRMAAPAALPNVALKRLMRRS
jgi:hypothetical protein